MSINIRYTVFGKQIGYVLIATICTNLFAFIQLALLTKWLGATLYGIWSIINVTIALITPFALLGFGMSIVRFLSAEKNINKIREDFLSACFIVFISGTVLSVFLFAFSNYIAINIFKNIDSTFYFKLASVLIFLSSIHAMTVAFFRTFRKIKLYSLLTIAQFAIQVGLITIFLLLGLKLTGVIIAFEITLILFILINFLIIFRQINFQFPKFSHIKSYLKYGIPLIPNLAILWILHASDRYMISYFLGATATGIYSAAYILSNQIGFLLGAITVVLFPAISKSFDEKKIQETKNYLKYSVKYFILITVPAIFGLCILATPILQIFTTTEFISGRIVIPFVAFSALFSGLFQIYIYIIHLVKKTHLTIRLLTIAAISNLVLNFILIPRIGILGAAIATLVAYGILGLLTLIITRKYFKVEIEIIPIIKSVFAASIMAICLLLMNPSSLIYLLASIILGIIIYFSIIILIKGINKKELFFLSNLVKKSIK